MESTNSFGVHFIIRHSKSKLSGALIYARITVDKKKVEISLNRKIDPMLWDSENQIAKCSKDLVNKINPSLDETRLKLIYCYRQLKTQKSLMNPDAIKRLFVGEEKVQNSLMVLILYKLKFQKTQKEFLIEEKIEALKNTGLLNEKLIKARDLFLFACYTGLKFY